MGKTYSRDREKPEAYRDLKRKAPKKKLRGFTLLELIVAIAVLGILSIFITGAIICSKDPQCEAKDKQQLQNSPAKNYLNN